MGHRSANAVPKPGRFVPVTSAHFESAAPTSARGRFRRKPTRPRLGSSGRVHPLAFCRTWRTGPCCQRGAVNDALLYDPRVNAFNIDPDIVGSTVTLRGKVDNLKAKRAAEQDVKNTVGVSYVENRLKVRLDTWPNDAKVAESIRNALLRDP